MCTCVCVYKINACTTNLLTWVVREGLFERGKREAKHYKGRRKWLYTGDVSMTSDNACIQNYTCKYILNISLLKRKYKWIVCKKWGFRNCVLYKKEGVTESRSVLSEALWPHGL